MQTEDARLASVPGRIFGGCNCLIGDAYDRTFPF